MIDNNTNTAVLLELSNWLF